MEPSGISAYKGEIQGKKQRTEEVRTMEGLEREERATPKTEVQETEQYHGKSRMWDS